MITTQSNEFNSKLMTLKNKSKLVNMWFRKRSAKGGLTLERMFCITSRYRTVFVFVNIASFIPIRKAKIKKLKH